MQIKTILAVFAMASLASAAPEPEGLEKRVCSGTRFCCNAYFPFNFLVISHLGSGCVKTPTAACTFPKKEACCSKPQLQSNGDLACFK
ncbi:uncharacterized protein NFIA_004930 [Aspergillus fischeri NRRL 181]|uniref:Uncharacterized protein n=1 Tax=Neosartorya fischeri (strain ATCC 1020 / DSM 3700 / CBS 544.65 / FGSC A1164 / JCM 1740 / NRRL 181 / WB 181) TaxID=331117 RepID=A1DK94_NEOFI|nr:uncharacterized protein NFIA_004930 [Aspergillus fischeri NRRL 181]EAW17133.1 hypothetical protein NFIA_004930 [Aspergillus fischeri NRRL 181]